MNLPTVLLGALIAAVFVAIVARGIYNKKHHKGGCSCGCGCDGCPSGGLCHPDQSN